MPEGRGVPAGGGAARPDVVAGSKAPGVTTTSPRSTSSRETPRRLRATRCPARTSETSVPRRIGLPRTLTVRPAGRSFQGIVGTDAAAPQGSCHHGAEPGHLEGPIHGEPHGTRPPDAGSPPPPPGPRCSDEVRKSLSRLCGDSPPWARSRETCPVRTPRTSSRTSSSHSSSTRSLLVRATTARGDPQEPQDVHVLPGLGHDPLIARHHQEDRIEARSARPACSG
jgi:hypothetical protein